jgi:hypothetical protein
LWRLRDHLIIDPVLPIEKEHRSDLKASTEAIKHTLANIPCSVATLFGFGPVNINPVGGIVHWLLHAQVNQTVNLAQLSHQVCCELRTGPHIISAKLKVNLCRESKIQYLCRDVGREKVKRDIRKLSRQPGPQFS